MPTRIVFGGGDSVDVTADLTEVGPAIDRKGQFSELKQFTLTEPNDQVSEIFVNLDAVAYIARL